MTSGTTCTIPSRNTTDQEGMLPASSTGRLLGSSIRATSSGEWKLELLFPLVLRSRIRTI